MPFTKLRRRVWWYPASPGSRSVQGGVGVIVGKEGSIVVDAGNSPDRARRIQSAMAEAGLPEARWLVYTHHHWDHTWGACAWPDVEIIGHEAGKAPMEAEAALPWSEEFIAERMAADESLRPSYQARANAVTDWDEFKVIPPHRTFSDRVTLPGDVELRHVGGHHAPDSTIVAVPGSKVMLLGDCFYPPPYHQRKPGDEPDFAMLRELITDDYRWYVDSHSPPMRRWRAKRLVR